MDVARVVSVAAAGRRGSGYLVAPRLVLTAGHVVSGDAATVRPVAGEAREAAVVWRGADAALLETFEDLTGGHVRWGRIVTSKDGIPAVAMGFPASAQRAGAAPETWQPSGTVNAGNRMVSDRYVLSLSGHPPQGASPWAGLSGAALFCGPLLTGVITADLAHGAHAQLDAVPVYVLAHDPAFAAVLVRHGAEGPVLHGVEFEALAEGALPAGRTPASLLIARRHRVRFRGREELLDRLAGWSGGGGSRAMLVHGSGGQGKTRLADELGRRLLARRWAVLWLRPGARAEDLAALARVAVPLLLIVDYAEGRSGQVAEAIRVLPHDRQEVRVLLLARAAGDWWTTLRSANEHVAELLSDAPVVALPELEPEAAGRAGAYADAVTDLADALTREHGIDPARFAGRRPYTDDGRPASALTLHMTALVDLLDAAHPPAAAEPPDREQAEAPPTVEDRLLDHERRYWRNTTDGFALSALSPRALEDALAATMLLGAADREEATDLLATLPALRGQPAERRDRVREWIAHLYPPPAGRPWGSLQPDRLAERFAGNRLLADEHLVDPLLDDASPAQIDQLLTVYARAAAHLVLRDRLGPLLTALCVRRADLLTLPAIDTATRVEEPRPLIDALRVASQDPLTHTEELGRMSLRIPTATHSLAGWAVEVCERLVEEDRAREDVDTETYLYLLGHSLSRLTLRYQEVGRRSEAVATGAEAVRAMRGLADVWPEKYRPELAVGLSSLAVQLATAGRLRDSVPVAAEAVAIRREIGGPADLARALNNLTLGLVELSRLDEAFAAITEAVALYRRLAERDPAEYRPVLAQTLSNLGYQLGRRGQWAESLTVLEEAVAMRRELVRDRPDAYRPQLAMSLNTLALRLHGSGRRAEALAAAEEAEALYRHLVVGRPGVMTPLLAMILHNLARYQAAAGRAAESRRTVGEAVALRRRLAAGEPVRFRGDLGASLVQQGMVLAGGGWHREAAASFQEALGILRPLGLAQPDEHLETYLEALRLGPARLVEAGLLPDALALAQEAVDVCREFADRVPRAQELLHRALQTQIAVQRAARGIS